VIATDKSFDYGNTSLHLPNLLNYNGDCRPESLLCNALSDKSKITKREFESVFLFLVHECMHPCYGPVYSGVPLKVNDFSVS
jgi:hypothetical protein